MRTYKAVAIFLLIGIAGIGWLSPVCAQTQQASSQLRNTSQQITYKDSVYGFCIALPRGWKGYCIQHEKWNGMAEGPKGDETVAQGPIVTIRHPSWVAQLPRQDIPIMVFTRSQWERLKNGKFFVSPAPIGPQELGRNSKYIFALPARYNFEFLTGYEEVEEIMRSSPLRAPCDSK